MDPSAVAGGDQQSLHDIQTYLTTFNKEISDAQPVQNQEFILQQGDGTVNLNNVNFIQNDQQYTMAGNQGGQATLTVVQANDGKC